MNPAMAYDPLKTTRALEAAGADRKLSEAIAEAIGGATVLPDTSGFVTRDILKAELAGLKGAIDISMAEMKASTDLSIAELKNSTDHSFAEVRASIAEIRSSMANMATKTDLASLKSSTELSIANLKNSLYLTIGSTFVATVGILGSLIAFTHH